jgi:hypothetical protein
MALKAIVDALDGVAEGIRENYRAGTKEEGLEGKFVLSVEGSDGWGLENVSGLKTALGQERTKAEQAERKVKKFGDLDPDAARAAIEKVAEFETLDPKKEADRLAQVKIDAATKQLVEKHNEETRNLKDRESKLRGTVQTLTIDNVAIKALETHKGNVHLLLPHVQRQVRLKEADDGSFSQEVVDADGNPRIGDAKGSPMTVDQLVEEMSKSEKFAQGFAGSGNSGTGSTTSNTTTTKTSGNFGGSRTERAAAIASKFPELAQN